MLEIIVLIRRLTSFCTLYLFLNFPISALIKLKKRNKEAMHNHQQALIIYIAGSLPQPNVLCEPYFNCWQGNNAIWPESVERVLGCSSCKWDWARSNELNRGPPELVSTFVCRGSSHRRKSAACSKFDMVWLYCLLIPVGRRGVISSFKLFLPTFDTRYGRGGVGTLWI